MKLYLISYKLTYYPK